MPARDRPARLCAGGLLVCLLGQSVACASNPAPQGWLPSPEGMPRAARGGWVVVTLNQQKEKLSGELIAVGDDGLQVLTGRGLQDVPLALVERAKVIGFDTAPETLGLWTVVGTFSTASHGYFLIFTVPLWLIGGLAAAAVESRAPVVEFPNKPLADVRNYARFPQGLAPGVDPASLGRLEVARPRKP